MSAQSSESNVKLQHESVFRIKYCVLLSALKTYEQNFKSVDSFFYI